MTLGNNFNDAARRYEQAARKPNLYDALVARDGGMMRYLFESGRENANSLGAAGIARHAAKSGDTFALDALADNGFRLDKHFTVLLAKALENDHFDTAAWLISKNPQPPEDGDENRIVSAASGSKARIDFIEKNLKIDIRDFSRHALFGALRAVVTAPCAEERARAVAHFCWLVEEKGVAGDFCQIKKGVDNCIRREKPEGGTHGLDGFSDYLERKASKATMGLVIRDSLRPRPLQY